MTERTINICGHEVRLRYCAATETGYEQISGQSADIFIPNFEKDEDGSIINVTPRAKTDDYLKLAIAAIIAAYARTNEEAPVTADDIIYEAKPTEVTRLLTTVMELRNAWYEVPAIVKPEEQPAEDTDEEDKPADEEKNA